MGLSTEELERAFLWLEQRVEAIPALARERAESSLAYFAHRKRYDSATESLATRRHLEWFLLERPSASQGGAPIEVLVNAGSAGGEAPDRDLEVALAALLTSLASVFEVTGVVSGEGVWVRDLAGGGEYALEEPEASLALKQHDLLVGRVFEVGDQLHRVSGSAGLFRDGRLTQAVRRDLERARESRRGTLRLSQAELEKMFWGDPLDATPSSAAAALQSALARARLVLSAGGLDEADCEAVFAVLGSEPQQALDLLPGASDALAVILERLAMESDVDLAAARAALLGVWTAMATVAALSADEDADLIQPRKRTMDSREAMQAFDRGRAEGRDLEQLFRELERDLGLDSEEDGAEEELAPDFPGVVAAMVEEYLWELDREGHAELAREHACLRKFGQFGASIGVFENLGRRDLLLFASIWLPELGELKSPGEALAVLDALEAFCDWCETQHALPLRAEFDAEVAALRESLPRLIAAQPFFESGVGPEVGAPFRVLAVEGPALVLDTATGRELRARVDERLSEHLRAGDWLRAEAGEDGELRVFCGYPPQSALLRPA